LRDRPLSLQMPQRPKRALFTTSPYCTLWMCQNGLNNRRSHNNPLSGIQNSYKEANLLPKLEASSLLGCPLYPPDTISQPACRLSKARKSQSEANPQPATFKPAKPPENPEISEKHPLQCRYTGKPILPLFSLFLTKSGRVQKAETPKYTKCRK